MREWKAQITGCKLASSIIQHRESLVAADGKTSAYNAGDPDLILGREDPLEKAVATHSSTLAWKIQATHSSTLAWKIPWTEECGGLQSMG